MPVFLFYDYCCFILFNNYTSLETRQFRAVTKVVDRCDLSSKMDYFALLVMLVWDCKPDVKVNISSASGVP